MEEVVRLTPPINKGQIERLSAGDKILVDGFIYTARDMAHKRLVDSLPDLPFPLEGQIIYYTGPTPPRPGYPIGSCGPTTSLRVDIYTLPLLAAGLVGTIGKGSRGLAVIEAIKKYGSIYLVAIGGAGAFLSKKVLASELVAYPDLGCEAIFRLKVKDFPCYVGIDSRGNDILQVSSFEGIERERTLVIIKPDGVSSRLVGEIIKRFEAEGFDIVEVKMVHLDQESAGHFYQVHQDKPFYQGFVAFMSSGPCVVMVLEGEGAIKRVREIIGHTDPKKAAWGTIRRDFATDIRYNIVHGSDSPATAKAERDFFFGPDQRV
ncbi:TPA: nucleoside-diphosphate kinase [bacterium]|nr:nucleoside-diphosphate kinase [bacterium]